MTAAAPRGARPLALPLRIVAAVRPRRIRFREHEFWQTQALVAAAVGGVYLFDATIRRYMAGESIVSGGLHDIPIMFVIVPVIYAAIVYGFEGGVLTTLWVAVLAMPHSLLVSDEEFEWLGDLGTLVTVLVAGIFLAVRTDKEREARRAAETVSERLRLLNELGDFFDRHQDVPVLLQELADRLRDGLELDVVWVRYTRGSEAREVRFVTSGDPAAAGTAGELSAVAALATERVRAAAAPRRGPDAWFAAPLLAEPRFMGALGAIRVSSPLTEEEEQVLATAASQASGALANLELQQERREALTSYARQVTNAQEDERRRIARELHDGVTQALSGLCRGLDVLQAEHGEAEPRHAEMVEQLRSVAEGALLDLRRLTHDLRPTVLDDLGLVSALEWLASELRERAGFDVTVTCEHTPCGLSSQQELGVFRIVQEALSNAEKHAGASSVDVFLECDEDGVRVAVRDDGGGFDAPIDPAAFARRGGYGLMGMRERAALNDGELSVRSVPGEGTTVALEMRPERSEAAHRS